MGEVLDLWVGLKVWKGRIERYDEKRMIDMKEGYWLVDVEERRER